MIKSKYVADILDLLLDGDDLGQNARLQLNFLTDTNYSYTGSGLFVTFEHSNGIEKLRSDTDEAIINGVEIKSEEFDIEAEALLSINGGLIEYLEIWSHTGKYPTKEPLRYALRQTWKGAPGREIVVI